MADAITSTQLDTSKQALISDLVQRELQFKAKLLPLVKDVSSFAVPGAKSISFPKLTSFTAVDRTEGVAGDATALTSSVDTMLLDKSPYVSYIVDKISSMQSAINAETEFAMRAGSSIARFIDDYIASAIEAAAGLSVNAGVPADVTKANILAMMSYIEGNDGNLDESVFVVSVDQRAILLNLADFSQNDIYGTPVNYHGQIGQLYGIPVIVYNGLGTKQVLCFEKNGMAHGFQAPVSFNSQEANEYGVGTKRFAYDCISGVQALQVGEKSAGAGNSPLIAVLRD